MNDNLKYAATSKRKSLNSFSLFYTLRVCYVMYCTMSEICKTKSKKIKTQLSLYKKRFCSTQI